MTDADLPVQFGYKMAWLAIRSTDPTSIIGTLRFSKPRQVSWKEGIERVYQKDYFADKRVFITPPVYGWTLVVGRWTGGWGEGIPGIENLVIDLSTRFGEAQAFSTHRVSEYHHWILARNGKLLRSLSYCGSTGEVLADTGELTPIESSLKINVAIPEGDDESAWQHHNPPNETDVMEVAGAWSVDPTSLDSIPALRPGILAKVP
jgi:hypothetical protein